MKHTMTIKPAILPADRHQIEKFLETLGYKVSGGGGFVNCDISFESDLENYPQHKEYAWLKKM